MWTRGAEPASPLLPKHTKSRRLIEVLDELSDAMMTASAVKVFSG